MFISGMSDRWRGIHPDLLGSNSIVECGTCGGLFNSHRNGCPEGIGNQDIEWPMPNDNPTPTQDDLL